MSFKSLVRSTLVIGSSSAVTTLVGVVRVKVLALLVGPAGIGLLGVFAGIASAGTTLTALGSDTSGTRQLALDKEDPEARARVRRALAAIAIVHGAIAILTFYLLRTEIARWAFGSTDYAWEVGLLGIVVACSMVAGLQIAQLQGLGRVNDIARVNILSAILGTAFGLAAVWLWGLAGLILLVLAQPALAAILATAFAANLPNRGTGRLSWHHLAADWRRIVRQGSPYMLSFLVLALVPLVIRAIVVHDLGIEAAGHFHAAWTMSVIYIGFLLNAMSADYFPRLTAIVGDRPAAIRLVNDQAQLGMAIGGVALVGMLALAPLLVPLLYSRAFTPAIEIVEWQAFGNLMKLAGWPVAFLAMARGRSSQFLLIELVWSAALLGLVVFGLPHFGLVATGMAFAIACAMFLVLQTVVAYWTYGFIWRRGTVLMLLAFLASGSITMLAARHSVLWQAIVGSVCAVALGLGSLHFIVTRIEGGGRLADFARKWSARIRIPGAGRLAAREG